MSTVILTDEDAKAIIAGNIRRLMAEQGLNQKQLAELSGESEMVISRIVRGKHVPVATTLANIADALGVTADELLTRPKEKAAKSLKIA